jgi:hypothetical protein
MALLAFDPATLSAAPAAAGAPPTVPPAISTLLDLSQRHQLASALNSAILASQFRDKGTPGSFSFSFLSLFYLRYK